MRQHLDHHTLATTLRMTRSAYAGAFVLVEGSGSDLKFFRSHLARDHCRLYPAHGKENLVGALQLLDAETFQGVLGIADADRDRLLGRAPSSPNLLWNDGCDLESMLLKSRALDKLLAEHASESKLGTEGAEGVRRTLLELARPLGALRLLSARDGLNLSFKELKFDKFLNKDLQLDSKKMLLQILEKSSRPASEVNQLHEQMQRLTADSALHSLDLCNGHDQVEILSRGLRKRWGSQEAKAVAPKLLERELRLAYEHSYLLETSLHGGIIAWEGANPPFQILPRSH